MSLRHIAVARGWTVKTSGVLLSCVLLAWLLGRVTIQLRSSTDFDLASPILDRGILVGLAVPVAVLTRNLEDRAAWQTVTGAKGLAAIRAGYFVGLTVLAAAVGTILAVTSTGQASVLLIMADFMVLFAVGATSAVLLGSERSWIAPGLLAIAASTPGLVPLKFNPLVRADQDTMVAAIALVATLIAAVLFIGFDDYQLSRRRLLGRTPGVSDE